jgi:hypothetical protein
MKGRLFLILLLCALVVPKAAWGAHLAANDPAIPVTAVHTHHGDHLHEADDERVAKAGDQADRANGAHDGEGDGLTHDHSPSLGISGALMLPDDQSVPLWFAPAAVRLDRGFAAAGLSPPQSVLRPPRAS